MPIEHHLQLGDVAQPLDVVPTHGRGLDIGQSGKVHTVVGWARLVIGCKARSVVALVALPGIVTLEAEQGLLVAASAAVDCHCHRHAAGAFGAPDVMRGHLELVGGMS